MSKLSIYLFTITQNIQETNQTLWIFFTPGALWSFYPPLNTVNCWKRTGGHRRNKSLFKDHRRKFKKKHIKKRFFLRDIQVNLFKYNKHVNKRAGKGAWNEKQNKRAGRSSFSARQLLPRRAGGDFSVRSHGPRPRPARASTFTVTASGGRTDGRVRWNDIFFQFVCRSGKQ